MRRAWCCADRSPSATPWRAIRHSAARLRRTPPQEPPAGLHAGFSRYWPHAAAPRRADVTTPAGDGRAERVQTALFRIAELASSVQDMQEFYREVHAVVGDFMYANNFF